MPPVDGQTVKARAARLREIGTARVIAHLQAQVGKTHNILMESAHMGRTEQFTEVQFETDQPEGRIVTAQITGAAGLKLTA
jgi:threonylcarbamoyladenosine tRNA methylthiotransferase MtaB